MSIGAFYGNFPLMQFSRFVFGMGGESLSVAQNTYASAWFRGDALNMVFGLQVTYIDKVPYFTKRPYQPRNANMATFVLLTTQTHTFPRGALRFATQISPLLNSITVNCTCNRKGSPCCMKQLAVWLIFTLRKNARTK